MKRILVCMLALMMLHSAVLAEAPAPSRTPNILIAYFTRLDNTNATLDEIVQGGGPYGEIGTSWADADLDAIASASITIMNDEVRGNTQAVAEMIAAQLGGELFSIQTVDTYPVDYDTLIDQGGEEGGRAVRPTLKNTVENMEAYDIVFIGFPNWWGDMPMAVYTFLESYDFTGKTIIPFATSASSGLARTASTMREMLQGADVIENGLHVRMYDVAASQQAIHDWLAELDLAQ